MVSSGLYLHSMPPCLGCDTLFSDHRALSAHVAICPNLHDLSEVIHNCKYKLVLAGPNSKVKKTQHCSPEISPGHDSSMVAGPSHPVQVDSDHGIVVNDQVSEW